MPEHPSDEPRRGPGLLVGGLAAAALVLGAVGLGIQASLERDSTAGSATHPGHVLRGRPAADSLPRPDFTLLDTDGRAFDFRTETEGRLALLFFGYTHCPDVCPVHMANLAAVLDELPYQDRQRVQVVFVTTDPARDDPASIRRWLDRFDRRFVGLRGSVEEVNDILARLHLPPATRGAPDEQGRYDVGHAAPVLAFGPDGLLRATYPFGTRQVDWAHDLPRLLGDQIRPLGDPPDRGA